MGSTAEAGNNGAFFVHSLKFPSPLKVIASDGEGWEHVSVSVAGQRRTPTWEEMAFVKDLFWDEEDAVIQFHPPRSAYVNHHPHCLHMWRPTFTEIPIPDPILVGPRP